MKAFLKNYRQSPRKVRLVTDLIKGKRVAEAFLQLNVLPKRASLPIQKLLASAVNNAKQTGISEDNLVVVNVTVNKGLVMKRSMPRARGSASRINKRTSHIVLTLAEKPARNASSTADAGGEITKKTKGQKKVKATK